MRSVHKYPVHKAFADIGNDICPRCTVGICRFCVYRLIFAIEQSVGCANRLASTRRRQRVYLSEIEFACSGHISPGTSRCRFPLISVSACRRSLTTRTIFFFSQPRSERRDWIVRALFSTSSILALCLSLSPSLSFCIATRNEPYVCMHVKNARVAYPCDVAWERVPVYARESTWMHSCRASAHVPSIYVG